MRVETACLLSLRLFAMELSLLTSLVSRLRLDSSQEIMRMAASSS